MTETAATNETTIKLVRADAGQRTRVWKTAAAISLVLAVITGVTVWWLNERHFESTDDAQIDGHIDPISARITGTVLYINPNVENNHFVEAGTLLLELDPNDYQVALEHAEADLTTRQAAVRSADSSVPVTTATAFSQLRQAEAAEIEALASVAAEEANLTGAQHRVEQDQGTYERAERDRERYLMLVGKHEISRSEYDARETESHTAKETLEADRAAVVSAQQKIAQASSRVVQRRAGIEGAKSAPDQVTDSRARAATAAGQVLQARADVHTATLNLGYTKIYAPVSGVIGRKTVEPGQRIQPGQALLAIVPVDDIWVTANFKETQLKQMRPGQAVTLHVDAFDRDYTGVVENLPGAAGTLFSLLPPENASGNYVKVVQRLPVRLRFNPDQDRDHLLRPGMSVEPRVRVQ
jgi:membrane fusion protein (multidrug efflux system)